MNFTEFKSAVFSVIQENDPHRESKELQLRNWCYSFFQLLIDYGPPPLPFVLDVLSEEDCWETTDSIHGIDLNGRKVAKKFIQPQSWTGKTSTLNTFERLQIASWCCLVEDITLLFDHFKQQYEIKDYDAAGLKKLIKELKKSCWLDPLTTYWLHIVGGRASELPLKGKHLYEYGLYLELNGRPNGGHFIGYVEGVEFFWNKIKLLPEHELNVHQKRDIFMKATVRAASGECANNPKIFEFCFSQLRPVYYPDFLRRVYTVEKERRIEMFLLLRYTCRFDHFQKMFDSLGPNFFNQVNYYNWLKDLLEIQYLENYANEVVNLFTHIWRKEGFDKHRAFVLRNEMEDSGQQGDLLSLLVKRNYMEPVWAILDAATPDQLKEFMGSKNAEYIYNVLQNRRDHGSLIRIFVPSW